MSPTPEASERQRKAAYKAWETIRRKQAAKTKGKFSEIADATKAHEADSELRETSEVKQALISPEHAYPKNWKQIVAEVRERARNADGREQCECHGECLKHHGRCEEINHTWPKHRRRKGKVKIRLTTAHLCHTPKCDNKSHLRAMCEPCHLIFDLRCRQRRLRGEGAVSWALQQSSTIGNQLQPDF
jgi:hypothetical protein